MAQTPLFQPSSVCAILPGDCLRRHDPAGQFAGTWRGAFAETGGASSDLRSAGKTDSLGYSTLGVHFLPDAIPFGDLEVMPKISFGWQHALNAFTPGQTIAFVATAQSFQVRGVPLSTDAVVGQLGFDIAFLGQGRFSLGYDGLISDREKDHAVRANFEWAF